MEEDQTVRLRRVAVVVTAIDQTHVTLVWQQHTATILLGSVPEQVRSLLKIRLELHADVHGASIYNLRLIPGMQSLRSVRAIRSRVR